MTLLLLLALTIPASTRTIHFDRVDVNHCLKPDGTKRFDQMIFWRWSRLHRRYVSCGYSMLQGQQQWPRRCGDRYLVGVIRDGQKWDVTADCMIETWTVNDPEADDRKRWPEMVREWE